MQRVKHKEKEMDKESYTNYNTIIPNGISNISPIRNNKFLSIQERQKIIHEINTSKNNFNFYYH